jgi:arginase family enzyme
VRRIAVLDAPSNLGLRPPTATSVPGCAKAPGALRDQGLLTKLGARDAGCLTPPRYDPGDWRPGDGVAHAAEIAAYSRALADRIGAIIDGGEFPVVLGGDCSILIGAGIAMHRLGDAVGGRIGLVFVDGHSDFRHPGNASYVGAAAGEDLALVTGRGQADLAAIESRRPYFRDIDVVVLGIRAQDEYRLDLQAAGIVTRPVPALRAEGAARSAQWARDQLVDCAGYWVHIDVDVLDPAVMPAVDAPDPGGIAFPELELLLTGLVESPHCLGVEITVFDPDYDPDGRYASEITSAVVSGLSPVRTTTPRPDLIAARRDLDKPATRRSPSRPGPLIPPAPPEAGPTTSHTADGLAPAAATGDDFAPAAPIGDESASAAVTVDGLASAAPIGDGLASAAAASATGDEFATDPDGPAAAAERPVTEPPVTRISIEITGRDSAPEPETFLDHTTDPADPDADTAEPGVVSEPGAVAGDPATSPVVAEPVVSSDRVVVVGGADAVVAEPVASSGRVAVVGGADAVVAEPVGPSGLVVVSDDSGVDAEPVPFGGAGAGDPDSSVDPELVVATGGGDGSGADDGLHDRESDPAGTDPAVSGSEAATTPGALDGRAEPAAAGLTTTVAGTTEPARGGLSGLARSDADFMLAVALATGHAPIPSPVARATDQARTPADHSTTTDAIVPRQATGDPDEAAGESANGNRATAETSGGSGSEITDDLDHDAASDGAPMPTSAAASNGTSAGVSDGKPAGVSATVESGDEAEPVPDSEAEVAEPDSVDGELEPVAETDDEPGPEKTPAGQRPEKTPAEPERAEVRLLSRPLGSAPLLDSEPLPATRPGMLRPRPPADGSFGPPAPGPSSFPGFPPGVA